MTEEEYEIIYKQEAETLREEDSITPEELSGIGMARFSARVGLSISSLEAEKAMASLRGNLEQIVERAEDETFMYIRAMAGADPRHWHSGYDKELGEDLSVLAEEYFYRELAMRLLKKAVKVTAGWGPYRHLRELARRAVLDEDFSGDDEFEPEQNSDTPSSAHPTVH